MPGFIKHHQNRGCSYNITILNPNGSPIDPAGGDIIRARIGREGEADVFSVTSAAATSNGSTFTKGAPENVLRLDAEDMDFAPGTYTLFVEVRDASDANDWKNADRIVFYLEDT